MSILYKQERKELLKHLDHDGGSGGGGEKHAFETTPLFSLAVRHAGSQGKRFDGGIDIDKSESRDSESGKDEFKSIRSDHHGTHSDSSDSIPSSEYNTSVESNVGENAGLLSQYGLLGFHIGDHPEIDHHEPILQNTRAPNSTFLCGSQGSGKSYTLSGILENCLVPDTTCGNLNNPLVGIVFHYDNEDSESGAEVASLCSRGVEVNVLVSTSNYHTLNEKYQAIARKVGGKINVERLLLRDEHLSIDRMHKLMNISENNETGVPLYVSVIHEILQQMAINGEHISLRIL